MRNKILLTLTISILACNSALCQTPESSYHFNGVRTIPAEKIDTGVPQINSAIIEYFEAKKVELSYNVYWEQRGNSARVDLGAPSSIDRVTLSREVATELAIGSVGFSGSIGATRDLQCSFVVRLVDVPGKTERIVIVEWLLVDPNDNSVQRSGTVSIERIVYPNFDLAYPIERDPDIPTTRPDLVGYVSRNPNGGNQWITIERTGYTGYVSDNRYVVTGTFLIRTRVQIPGGGGTNQSGARHIR